MAKKGYEVDLPREEKRKLLRMSEISLWLDHYDDIFSDFDPRPYSVRVVSHDLLLEARRASRDKVSGQIELKFLMPKHERKKRLEPIIKSRLRDYFKNHLDMSMEETKDLIKEGSIFVGLGIIFMLITSFILFENYNPSLLRNFLIILLEPAGWFFFWEGLDLIIFGAKEKKADIDFYDKMAKAEISFLSF